MKITHKQKVSIARRLLNGVKAPLFNNKFWNKRAEQIANRVARKQNRKIKILDDKGNEHQEGEIFESETMTIEI